MHEIVHSKLWHFTMFVALNTVKTQEFGCYISTVIVRRILVISVPKSMEDCYKTKSYIFRTVVLGFLFQIIYKMLYLLNQA